MRAWSIPTLLLVALLWCVPHGATQKSPASAHPSRPLGLVVPGLSLTGKTISGTYTIAAADPYTLYYADTSGGPVIVNLPPTAFQPITYGQTFYFTDIKQNAGVNNITLVPAGADKINGAAANFVVSVTGSYTIVTTDAAGNWYTDTIGALGALGSPINWPSTAATLQSGGTPLLSLGKSVNDYIAIGAQPAVGGSIRLDNPGQILFRTVTGEASSTNAALRANSDDSIGLGGIGTEGIAFTVYKPNGSTDRNIVYESFADSTQPTKDFLSLGGPDPTNANGSAHVSGSGFLRFPQPTSLFNILTERNGADNGDLILMQTTPGNLIVGSLSIGNLQLQSTNNIDFNSSGQCSNHFGDNSADCMYMSGSSTSATSFNFGTNVTAATIGFVAAQTTANGSALTLSGQNATGAAHNGGPLNLTGGSSGSGTQGVVNLQGAGTSLLTIGDSGLHTQSSSVAITTGTTTLTAAQYQFPYITLTGSISGNVTVVFPTTIGATWIVDASGVTLNAHTITLQANSVAWATTVATTNLYRVTYGGSGKLYGEALTP